VFDLDPRHRAAAPVVRSIKDPADHEPLYAWVALESPILDVVSELIGPSLRFHHSKLNLKGGHLGAPVGVHEDAAFYPHSNDDVLAVGSLLDDAPAENGAMTVLPGSNAGRSTRTSTGRAVSSVACSQPTPPRSIAAGP
jgi:phytanoyl-CoA hydroxylase